MASSISITWRCVAVSITIPKGTYCCAGGIAIITIYMEAIRCKESTTSCSIKAKLIFVVVACWELLQFDQGIKARLLKDSIIRLDIGLESAAI